MPTVDVDHDTAHDAAQRELSKPIYPKGSASQRLGDWLDELLYRIIAKGSQVPGGWFTITVLLILVAVAVVVAVRVARRTMRTDRGDFILDNLRNKVMDWSDTEYTYLKRQDSNNPGRWVKVQDGRNVSAVAGIKN